MSERAERLKQKGYDLKPQEPPSKAWMDKVVIVGDLAFVSGHTCGNAVAGKVPSQQSVEQARKGAELATVGLLNTINHALGSLERVERLVRLNGYVNADPDFTDVSSVIHGASELLYHVFGDAGKHARTALGMAQLPGGTSVEVDLILQVKP